MRKTYVQKIQEDLKVMDESKINCFRKMTEQDKKEKLADLKYQPEEYQLKEMRQFGFEQTFDKMTEDEQNDYFKISELEKW